MGSGFTPHGVPTPSQMGGRLWTVGGVPIRGAKGAPLAAHRGARGASVRDRQRSWSTAVPPLVAARLLFSGRVRVPDL